MVEIVCRTRDHDVAGLQPKSNPVHNLYRREGGGRRVGKYKAIWTSNYCFGSKDKSTRWSTRANRNRRPRNDGQCRANVEGYAINSLGRKGRCWCQASRERERG